MADERAARSHGAHANVTTGGADDPFRRLLRWHPASWRRAHGDIVIGLLRDVAEAEGRSAPSRAERRATTVDGLARRLDRRLALVTAVVATILAVGGVAAYLVIPAILRSTAAVLPPSGDPPTAASIIAFGAIFSAPLFIVVSLIATLRVRGLRAGAALASVVLAAPAMILLPLAAASWSIGFDEADAGLPRSPFAAAWMYLAAASALLAAAAIAIVVGAALAGPLHGWAHVVGAAAGLFTAPALLAVLPSPVTTALSAIAVLVLAEMGTRERESGAASPTPSPTSGPRQRPASAGPALPRDVPRRWITGLATVSFALGAAAVAFALAGSQWTALDATEAMRAGIAAGALAAVPLILCLGLARTAHRTRDRWGPTALLVLAAVAVAIVNATSDGDGNAIVWQLTLCAVPVAGAAGWLTITSARMGSRGILVLGAALVVLVLALGILVLPFVVPLGALAVALVTGVRHRSARPPRAVRTGATAP